MMAAFRGGVQESLAVPIREFNPKLTLTGPERYRENWLERITHHEFNIVFNL